MTCSTFLHYNPESLWHGILFLSSNFNSEELPTALLSIALVYLFQTKEKKLWIMLQLSSVHSLWNQVHTLSGIFYVVLLRSCCFILVNLPLWYLSTLRWVHDSHCD